MREIHQNTPLKECLYLKSTRPIHNLRNHKVVLFTVIRCTHSVLKPIIYISTFHDKPTATEYPKLERASGKNINLNELERHRLGRIPGSKRATQGYIFRRNPGVASSGFLAEGASISVCSTLLWGNPNPW